MTADSMRPDPARNPREFMTLLRQLRNGSGLTYRQIESWTAGHGDRIARSTVAAALERSTLPRAEIVHGIVRACGGDPGPWLTIRQRLLSGPEGLPDAKAVVRPTPHQLPPEDGDFVGREAELAALSESLVAPRSRRGPIVLCGPPGCGKSALAVQASRQCLSSFPDGQLYVDLQGTTASAQSLGTREIAARLLRGLGVDADDLPPTAPEAAALVREVVADRRLLVVLDNARSVVPVRPVALLNPCSVVLITARAGLTSLAGSYSLALTSPPPEAGVALLTRLIGVERCSSEPDAVRHLAELCDYLPLALRVAAARLAARPRWSVQSLVERLADSSRRLDELHVDDLDVRTSLAVSYDELLDRGDAVAARARQLLTALPGGRSDRASAADLLAASPAEIDAAMDRLADLHLIESSDNGGFRVPELVRLLAREQLSSRAYRSWPQAG